MDTLKRNLKFSQAKETVHLTLDIWQSSLAHMQCMYQQKAFHHGNKADGVVAEHQKHPLVKLTIPNERTGRRGCCR